MPESVWDYPRPPKLERTSRVLRVEFAGVVIAETRNALRLLETSHPPTYYIPKQDVKTDALVLTTQTTFCEYKLFASIKDERFIGRLKSETENLKTPLGLTQTRQSNMKP